MNEEITRRIMAGEDLTDEQMQVVIRNAVENTPVDCNILEAFRIATESLDDAP